MEKPVAKGKIKCVRTFLQRCTAGRQFMEISNDTWNPGPAGELNNMEKPVKQTLYFYFGLLN
jgi:hypothetical protein